MLNKEIFLKDLKKFGEKNNIPNISEKNANFLRNLVKISRAKNILEIGMANGFSTINFAFELEKINGKITSIEFSPNSYEIALLNFQKAGVGEIIKPILGNALDEIPKQKDNFFDLIFIDAMKKRSLDFLKLSRSKLKKNGIMIIDDVIKFRFKMENLYEYLDKSNINYNILPIDLDDGIIMIVKE